MDHPWRIAGQLWFGSSFWYRNHLFFSFLRVGCESDKVEPWARVTISCDKWANFHCMAFHIEFSSPTPCHGRRVIKLDILIKSWTVSFSQCYLPRCSTFLCICVYINKSYYRPYHVYLNHEQSKNSILMRVQYMYVWCNMGK